MTEQITIYKTDCDGNLAQCWPEEEFVLAADLDAYVKQQLAEAKAEIATLSAAIATPEVYVGVITRVLESERDAAIQQFAAHAQRIKELEITKDYQVRPTEAIIHRNAFLEQRIKELEEERDLAIAHDRQPYPTADAYEKVCVALTKHKALLDQYKAAGEFLLAAINEWGFDQMDRDAIGGGTRAVEQVLAAHAAMEQGQTNKPTWEEFRFHYSHEWDTDEFLGWDELRMCMEQLRMLKLEN